ncbi:hypothetical protein MUP77_12770 [Candidatus Bathyarchaeota archaeon]|nr:hypothetical protein [Candidatus Bathyarchaeota archaeon]
MRKEGYRDSTVRNSMKLLKRIIANCKLLDVDDFKDFLSKTQWSDGRKSNSVDVYRCYAKSKGFKAENLPRY